MWATAFSKDIPCSRVFLIWWLLGLLQLLLPVTEWRRVAPFVLLGWVFGFWNMGLGFTTSSRDHATMECLDCRPRFTPSEGRTTHYGVFRCRNGSGQMKLIWLNMPDTALRLTAPSWIRVSRPAAFDMSDAFDFPRYLSSLGVASQGEFLGVVNARPLSTFPRERPNSLSERWRTWVRRTYDCDESGLVLGMFAGDKKSVHPEVQKALRQLGLSHLLAVSGYHVALVSLFFFLLLRLQQRTLRMLSVFGVALAWVFVGATGWSLSAVRAAVMASLGWWFMLRGKSLNPWGLLGAAACVVACIDPQSPCQLGAQLSFAATASLMALKDKRSAWRIPIRAQWATLPWNVHDFQMFPLLFYPANVIAAVAVWGFGCCVAGSACGFTWLDHGLGLMSEGSLVLSRWINGLEGLTWSVGWIDRAGLSPIVWGTTLLWVCPLLQGHHRQVWVRNAMGVAVLMGTFFNQRSKTTDGEGRSIQGLWHVSARTSTWLLEDGWRGCIWTGSSRDSIKAVNLARHLGLSCVEWNTSWKGPNATKSQPPFEVWDFGQNPGVTCEVTIEHEVSSISGAE